MKIYIDMILLATIVVFVVNLSGWTDTWKGWLAHWLKVKVGRVRPFDCEVCMVWWSCIILLLVRGELSMLTLAFTAFLAYTSRAIGELLSFILYALETSISLFNKLLDLVWQKILRL